MRRNQPNTSKSRILSILGILSALVLVLVFWVDNRTTAITDPLMDDAKERMMAMLSIVSPSDLIGPEWTEMTSTIGHLDAKRTSIQPEFASLMVQLLNEASIRKGDTIALACSGSFPGLLLATLAAAEAMEVHCRLSISLGSSSYGANRPELTVLDIYEILDEHLDFNAAVCTVSLGGENDTGMGWEKPVLDELANKIEKSGYPFIREEKLTESVRKKIRLLGFEAGSIKVFINAGGAMANIGRSSSVLRIKPGLVKKMHIPEIEFQGLIHAAFLRDIPVIHLLYLKGLALEYGLKWDPVFARNAE